MSIVARPVSRLVAEDDRGRTVPIGEDQSFVVLMRIPRKERPTRPRGAAEVVSVLTLTREVAAAYPRMDIGKRGIALSLAILTAMAAFFFWLRRNHPTLGTGDTWFLLAGMGFCAGVAVYGLLETMGFIREDTTKLPTIPELLAETARQGNCFACDYPLAGLQSDPDGCTVCPECGAAWRL